MQKITIEDMIISLLIIGFKEVDALLITFTFSFLFKLDNFKNNFVYADENTTNTFSKCIEYENECYKFKKDISKETVKELENKNEKLVNY